MKAKQIIETLEKILGDRDVAWKQGYREAVLDTMAACALLAPKQATTVEAQAVYACMAAAADLVTPKEKS